MVSANVASALLLQTAGIAPWPSTTASQHDIRSASNIQCVLYATVRLEVTLCTAGIFA